ncbi:MAG TPA: BrnT family toxin [Acetobacteraceae bacterium]|nr:BrnT family toxin [Acetobacteraceae bacterium]
MGPCEARGTRRERGFGFDHAARVFAGRTIEAADIRRDYGEDRVRAIGEIDGRVYVVIYTDRPGVRWIISAWQASGRDRRLWHSRR